MPRAPSPRATADPGGAGRRYRLRSYLFFSGLLFLVLLAISVAFYQSNRSFLLNYIREINTMQAEAYGRMLDSIFFRASYASAAIADRSRVQTYVAGGNGGTDVQSELEQTIVELLQLFAYANTEISSIYVYSAERDRITTDRLAAPTRNFHDHGWLPALTETAPTRPTLLYREDPVFSTPMLTLARRMDDGSRFAGGVLIHLEIEHVRRLIGRGITGDGKRVFVVQEGTDVVFSTHDEDLGRAPREDFEPLFLASTSGALFNLEYYLYSGSELFDEKMEQLRRYLVVLLITVLLIGAGLSVVLTRFSYRPIREIVETIENPDRRASERARDEVGFIEDSIVRMMASNRRLEERLAERFQSLSRAHYAALQLQINPHFLYNTLESIYWNCVEVFDPRDPVPTSVLSLSRFLRMVIATDAMAIPLSEELEIVQEYLTLLRLRYEDRLVVRWLVPDDLRSVQVPKLILQPLVENAFYHGIKPLRRRGTVTVAARQLDRFLELTVSDDGCGMSSGRVAELTAMLTSEFDLSEDHIGLLNVAQRMRILYGRAARLEIESAEQAGTTVRLTMPDEMADSVPEAGVPAKSDKKDPRM
jgi:two-component system, sensor histidine kinase YesM